MSRSYRTEKESHLARRRIRRDAQGEIVLPRVVERKPARDDSHPIPAHVVRNFLADAPIEYVYGLKRIELRARRGTVGHPFAYYSPSERVIVLYSVPPVWEFAPFPIALRRSMRRFFATIDDSPGRATARVTWPVRELGIAWFCYDVLAHELGHHIRRQYRHKRGRYGRRNDEEIVAELHSGRFFARLTARIRAKRRARALASA